MIGPTKCEIPIDINLVVAEHLHSSYEQSKISVLH